ncbi:hypothetical protein BD309DRAFT_1082448 [Dichomitus squalens]|uniref:Uncharacterized protein n=1 Tax=Dichomitus squalens TaxID=114155 RepID=A0A4Q9MAF0_9APHY|nr:hypothetical protein BD311DRAFT_868311 [Dichomitus squalens]TBU40859.1 hypothetical protein BD309DRAFT_1082448 [Dichomitus squalens]TBU56801.1 hypothetical protein BD310DRAFT_930792 [Dichomitus squalens]
MSTPAKASGTAAIRSLKEGPTNKAGDAAKARDLDRLISSLRPRVHELLDAPELPALEEGLGKDPEPVAPITGEEANSSTQAPITEGEVLTCPLSTILNGMQRMSFEVDIGEGVISGRAMVQSDSRGGEEEPGVPPSKAAEPGDAGGPDVNADGPDHEGTAGLTPEGTLEIILVDGLRVGVELAELIRLRSLLAMAILDSDMNVPPYLEEGLRGFIWATRFLWIQD